MRRRNLCRFLSGLMAAGFLAGISLGIHPLVSMVLILGVMLVTTRDPSPVEARAGPNQGYTPSFTDNVNGTYGFNGRTATKRSKRHPFIFTAPTNGPHQHDRAYAFSGPIRASPTQRLYLLIMTRIRGRRDRLQEWCHLARYSLNRREPAALYCH